MADRARFDQNTRPTLAAVSNADGETPVSLWADPITHGLIISASLSISGADGAIVDGASSAIRATVFSLTNSKPLATQIVDGTGTAITSFGGGTEFTDKSSFTEGTSGGIKPAGAVFNDTISADPAEDQITALRITAKKGLHVNLRTAAGVEIGTSGSPIFINPTNGVATQTNLVFINSTTVAVNNGVSSNGVQRVTLASDSTGNIATIGTSVTPGTGATHLGKAEDAVHTTGDTGVMALAVRNDAGTALAGTTGDYIPLSTDANGALRVSGAGGGTQYAEDTAHVSGDTGTMALGVRNDAATVLSGTDGDYTPMATTQEGYTQVASGFKEQAALTAGSLNADLVASTDVSQYRWFSIQVTGTWVGTLTIQGSNDNSTWVGIQCVDPSSATGSIASTTTSNRVYNAAITLRYLRVRMTAYTSGTATGVLELYGTVAQHTFTNIQSVASSVTPGTNATQLGKAEDAAHASGDTGVFMLGVRNDAQTTLSSTDGDYSAMATDGPGNVRIVGNVNAATTDSGSPIKVGGIYNSTLPTYTNGQRGDLQIGIGGSLNVTLFAKDSSSSIAASNDNVDAFTASATNNKLMVIGRGTLFNGTTWDRQRGDTNGTYVVPKPVTAGGLTMSKTISAASTNATSVKGSAGQLYNIQVYNTNAAARYLKLYNKASAPTVGTDVPVKVITVPGNAAGAGSNVSFGDVGIAFGTGIAFALTTGAADSDTGAVAANELIVNLDYA